MLLSTSEGSAKSVSKAQDNTRRGSMVNHRNGLKAALNIPIRAPKPQSLPSYLVKVLLSLVQARLEAQVWSVYKCIVTYLYGAGCGMSWCRK